MEQDHALDTYDKINEAVLASFVNGDLDQKYAVDSLFHPFTDYFYPDKDGDGWFQTIQGSRGPREDS